MNTPWQLQHDLTRANDAELATTQRHAAQLRDLSLGRHRLPRRHRLRTMLSAVLRRPKLARIGRTRRALPDAPTVV